MKATTPFSHQRDAFMDCLKGVAIFMVAWGHAAVFFQGHVVWLSLFAMPLFMGVSGYFFPGSLERHTCRQLIASKIQRLLLPSLTMGCCDALMMTGSKLIAGKPLDPEYLGSLIVVGLWFLTTLFVLSAVGALLRKSFKGWKFYIAWAGVYGLLLMPMPMVWVVNELRCMLPFFVIGIACGNLRWSAVPYWLGFVALLVFALCLFHYDWSCSLYEMQPDTMTLDWHAKQLLRIVGGLAGSIVALALLRAYVQLFGLGGGAFVRLGALTLPVYALHQKFLLPMRLCDASQLPGWLGAALGVLLTCAICLASVALYRLMRKSSILALLFFGERATAKEYSKG